MPPLPPTIYILHGDDDQAAMEFLAAIRAKLGDPSVAEMNTTRLEPKGLMLSDVSAACLAMPFLAKRRLVILDGYLSALTARAPRNTEKETPEEDESIPSAKKAMQDLVDFLEKVPPSTALVLSEKRKLPVTNAALKWASAHPAQSFVREFAAARGAMLVPWIQKRAQAAGGSFTVPAAQLLAATAGDDPRTLSQEIEKLITYSGGRPVQPADVSALTPESALTNIFEMVDAIGSRDRSRALRLLRQSVEQGSAFSVFGMIVRQFRYLLLAREALDGGTPPASLATTLGVHPFVAQKIAAQARGFTLPALMMIFKRLRDMDEDAKLGRAELDMAMESLAFELAR